MAAYDVRGQHVIEACRSEGILVPEQVAVVGVDPLDLPSAFLCFYKSTLFYKIWFSASNVWIKILWFKENPWNTHKTHQNSEHVFVEKIKRR